MRSILLFESTRPLELATGLASIARGLAAIDSRSASFFGAAVTPAMIVSVTAAGAAFLSLGAVQVWGLVADSRAARIAASLATSAVAAYFLTLYLRHSPLTLAAPMYGMIWLTQFFVAVRVGLDRRRAVRANGGDHA